MKLLPLYLFLFTLPACSCPEQKNCKSKTVEKNTKSAPETKSPMKKSSPSKKEKFIQNVPEIKLPPPRKTGGKPLMEALNNRKTTRKFATKPLPLQLLSNLLWAASGINRPDGKMTAPTATNAQEIEIYAATAHGLFFYHRQDHKLVQVLKKDLRPVTGKQKFTNTAPLVLIYVGNYTKMNRDRAKVEFYFATDTGFVSQNVYLFCASENLATVVIGWLDKEELQKEMKLDNQKYKVVLTQPVGYKVP